MTQPIVLVLAGGASTRFWPLRDKLFIELGGQSLLGRHLRALRELGCERFVVVTRPEAGAGGGGRGGGGAGGAPGAGEAGGRPGLRDAGARRRRNPPARRDAGGLVEP